MALSISLRNSLRNNFMKMSWISSEDPMKGISWPIKLPIFHEDMSQNISWAMKLLWKAVRVYFVGHEKMEWDLHWAWICHQSHQGVIQGSWKDCDCSSIGYENGCGSRAHKKINNFSSLWLMVHNITQSKFQWSWIFLFQN